MDYRPDMQIFKATVLAAVKIRRNAQTGKRIELVFAANET